MAQQKMKAAALPPDPESMNDARSTMAQRAIDAFMGDGGTDLEDALCDLIRGLAHWADRNDEDMGLAIRRAIGHYEAETDYRGEQFDAVSVED